MTVNLAWRNAVAETNARMNNEEFEAGFAERLSNHVIAHFQVNNRIQRTTPLTSTERIFGTTEWRLVQAMRQQLEADCTAGAIPWAPWCGVCQESDYYMIAAPDFAAWLAAQGMEPSPHIAAWFKAQGAGEVMVQITPAPAPTAAGRGKRWTPESLAEMKAYRTQHGTKATAAHYGISASLVRQKLPGDKQKAKGYSVYTHLSQ